MIRFPTIRRFLAMVCVAMIAAMCVRDAIAHVDHVSHSTEVKHAVDQVAGVVIEPQAGEQSPERADKSPTERAHGHVCDGGVDHRPNGASAHQILRSADAAFAAYRAPRHTGAKLSVPQRPPDA